MTNKHNERVERILTYAYEFTKEQPHDFAVLRKKVSATLTTHTKEVREQTLAEVREVIANKKTREMQTGENLGKYKAFQRGEEHMRSKLLDTLENK